MNTVITLTTDFGISDPYVGMMKGVILSIHPSVEIIDLTHHIQPQNLIQAAWAIRSSFMYFPAKTLHMVVVDPGVGTDRRIIAIETEKYVFLSPDNGVLTLILDELEAGSAYHIDNPDYFLKRISRTFHGREIFAPVGAHIYTGVDIRKMGRRIDFAALVKLDIKEPCMMENNRLCGSIVNIDRLGYLTTDIDEALMEKSFPEVTPDRLRIRIGEKEIKGLSENYQGAEKYNPLALIGSSGFLEIALNCGSAASFYQASMGDQVMVCMQAER